MEIEEVIDPSPHPGPNGSPGVEKAEPVPMDREQLKSILESLIFVADEPVTDRRLARAARATVAEVRPLLEDMVEEYQGRGVELHKVAGGYQFRSASANASFVRTLIAPKPIRLTRAQLETLAIVAYRQPVTRPEIEEIRGVDSGSALKVLADRDMLKVLGRKDEPGRPLLYGTTPHFLEFFNMNTLKDLPTLKEFSELSDESRALFERRMGEPIDLHSVEEEVAAAEAAAQEEIVDWEDELDEDDRDDDDEEDIDDDRDDDDDDLDDEDDDDEDDDDEDDDDEDE